MSTNVSSRSLLVTKLHQNTNVKLILWIDYDVNLIASFAV